MRRIVWASAILFGCFVVGWSQGYYEASGQTQVFTLAAGAKAGPTAIKRSPLPHTGINNDVKVMTIRGDIVVTLPALQRGGVYIAFYDIKGRQIYCQRSFNGTILRLQTTAFAPGVYSMLVYVSGKAYTRRLAVNRRGE